MELVTTVLLWLVGIVCLGAGVMKALLPGERITANPNMAWVEREGLAKARIAGVMELLAAAAMIGTALGIGFLEDGLLAAIAAFGFATLQGLAALTIHSPADEPTLPNMVLSAISLLLGISLLAF